MNVEENRTKLSMCVQYCCGCFVAFYMKDLWLGDNATFYCEQCKDETMVDFEEFSCRLDASRLFNPQAHTDRSGH